MTTVHECTSINCLHIKVNIKWCRFWD